MDIAGIPSRMYRVETTRDFQHWSSLGAFKAGPNGLIRHLDESAVGSRWRFPAGRNPVIRDGTTLPPKPRSLFRPMKARSLYRRTLAGLAVLLGDVAAQADYTVSYSRASGWWSLTGPPSATTTSRMTSGLPPPLQDVRISLQLSGGYLGDLYVALIHEGVSTVLLDRRGAGLATCWVRRHRPQRHVQRQRRGGQRPPLPAGGHGQRGHRVARRARRHLAARRQTRRTRPTCGIQTLRRHSWPTSWRTRRMASGPCTSRTSSGRGGDTGGRSLTWVPQPVPEPAELALGVGLGLVGWAGRRRTRGRTVAG